MVHDVSELTEESAAPKSASTAAPRVAAADDVPQGPVLARYWWHRPEHAVHGCC
ncbi:hypothetical protein ABZY90_17815 [Streptomyces sp. NPDC006422]|uniref:hypothetical protein n=1 Tax=unclassified Streptomyces TaxID=2593676 RepID=UPI00339FD512